MSIKTKGDKIMGNGKYKFDSLREKYDNFLLPMVSLVVNDKEFAKNKYRLFISDIEIELTSRFEASAASYRIYNCIEENSGKFKFDEVKDYILLGSKVSLELGYGGTTEEVFRGFIAQVQFLCESEDIPCIEVTAMDVKGIMMANSYARQLQAACYSEAVKEIFQRAGYQKLQSEGIVSELKITDSPDKKNDQNRQKASSKTIEMVSESDYEFIVKAAKRFNYEFFTDIGTVYFRKAKQNTESQIEIGPGQGLLSYQIGYDIRGLTEEIEVRGMNTGKGEAVFSKKKLGNKISMGNKAKSLISKTSKIYIDSTVQSKEQADFRIKSLIENMAYRFGSMEGKCVGIPELKPGRYLEIKGLGAPPDNKFYITNVRHVLTDETGFYTEIMGCSDGMKERVEGK